MEELFLYFLMGFTGEFFRVLGKLVMVYFNYQSL